MEITADYQKLSDLNVAFYNQDINTSILQFDVTRNNVPVPLGKVNVEGYIVLLAADGSRIQDTVAITNELNGVIEYTIPKEFLKHTGKALGQIYIAVKGKDDTAVMRQFSFDIEKDLLTSFSATIKLEYIKTFDDLTTFIKQRVDAIDEAIANGEDYVTAMEKASEKGQKDIQAVATKATTDINDTAVKAMTDINKTATDATKNVTDTSNTAISAITAKGNEVLKTFKDNGQVPKITADNGAPRFDLNSSKDLFVEISSWGNGFFTFYLSAGAINNPTGTSSWIRGTANNYGKNSNVLAYDKNGTMYVAVCDNTSWGAWDKASVVSTTQNFRLTADDGSSLTLANYDLLNTTDVSNFDGYVTTSVNAPTSVSSGFFKRKVRTGYIEVTFSPYSANTVYRNAYHFGNKTWFGWEKISTSQSVTLWEGSANGASSAVYTLSRAVNFNRKIRVTFNFVGGDGLTSTFDFKTSRVATFNNFNISDATAMEPALYELQLDFTSLTGFTIKLDNLHNLVTGAGSINRKAYTVIRVEEVD